MRMLVYEFTLSVDLFTLTTNITSFNKPHNTNNMIGGDSRKYIYRVDCCSRNLSIFIFQFFDEIVSDIEIGF